MPIQGCRKMQPGIRMSKKLIVMLAIGTRPEAIKMAPIYQKLIENPMIETRLCLTAQHREMLDQVLSIFNIKADIDLNLMTENQSLVQISSAILTQMSQVFRDTKPDWVLVQGDTTTVMTSALAAFYNNVRIGHVEAGLRSNRKNEPFPEEINRRIASVLADLHFAPTELARQNLLREGIPAKQIVVTGNPVIDALQQISAMPFSIKGSMLENIPFEEKRILTVTAHRRENHGEPLEQICQALSDLSEKYSDCLHIVFPVHLNPIVRNTVTAALSNLPNVSLLPPLEYRTFIHLLKRTRILLTDSGGLQEEAPGLGVPVLVLREVTERPEGVDSGNLRLIGTERNDIVCHVSELMDNQQMWQKMSEAKNPYGDGKAAERIVAALLHAAR